MSLSAITEKMGFRAWEIAQKILATQAWKTEFYWCPMKSQAKYIPVNPNAGQEEIGGFLRLTVKVSQAAPDSVRDPASNMKSYRKRH